MSLQVWLPLNGSLENKGLNQKHTISISRSKANSEYPTAHDLYTTTNGKVTPSSYKWTSNGQAISLNGYMNTFKDYKKYSIAAWFFYTQPSGYQHSIAICSSGDWNDGSGQLCFGLTGQEGSQYGAVLVPNTAYWGTSINNDNGLFALNTWYHICVTYDGEKTKLYINGIKQSGELSTGGITPSSETSNLYLGAATYFPGFTSVGSSINDFRIYDHCLSSKEVKLLSQGLVAHYQLKGMGRTNYLKGSDKYTKDTPLIRKASDTNVPRDSYIYYDLNTFRVDIEEAGTYTIVFESDGIPSEHKTYYAAASERRLGMWLHLYGSSESKDYRFWQDYKTGPTGELYGKFDLPVGTHELRTNLYADDGNDYTVKLWNLKLVKGTYDPNDTWCPHVEDELYTKLGRGTEPDCSGYNHRGSSVVLPECAGGSPRYGSCYSFVGDVTNKIYNTTTDLNFTDNFSWSCWVKHNYTGWKAAADPAAASYAFTVGRADAGGYGYGLGEQSSTAMYMLFGSARYDITIDESWHHLAFTKSGNTICIYVDGVQTTKTFSGALPTYSDGNGVGLGCFHFSSSLYPYYGSLSDFRIYATALSKEDILDLYKNSASVDKSGQLLAYDFHENSRNTVDKSGIVASSSFNYKNIPTYDMKVKTLDDGSIWARIHHLDVSEDKTFFANEAEVKKCTDKNNRYSRMGDVDKYKSKPRLPNGYTELEYIQSSGTQYVDTGFIPNQDTRIDTRFSATGVANRNIFVYGSGVDSSTSAFELYPWGERMQFNYGNDGRFPGPAIANNIITTVQDKNVSKYIINNTTYSETHYIQSFTTPYTLTLFALHRANMVMPDSGMKLYSCQIYDNGTLVRNFVPCKNPSGSFGLFDLVENKFYSNVGTGSFTGGDFVSTYEFMLTYPRLSSTDYNRWIQTSSPNASAASGYCPISISWPQTCAGLRKHGSSSLYNCDIGDTWYAPIGQYHIWEGGIPAANRASTGQSETELWVRVDKVNNETNFNIFSAAITAADFIEL